MAIPALPQNFYVSQGNRQVYLKWNLVAGATSYSLQRSLDNVTFSVLASPTNNDYTDSAVTVGTQYFYKVASVNGSGTSSYTNALSIVPAPTGEMSLGELRLSAQQRADRVNSDFVSVSEWNRFINLALNELYDLLITTYEDYFLAPRARLTSNGTDFIYPLPDGAITFNDANNQPFVPKPFYKLMGVDLGIQTASNAFVTMDKYNLMDRNRFVYPNSASTIYGIFNLRYRVLGTNIEFTPTPSAGQTIQLLYIPRLQMLLSDSDVTTIGFSGWLEYVIVRAAKYALDKEESDTQGLDGELVFLKGRIEESAMNRDAGRADTITDVRQGNWWGSGSGWNGPVGGM